MDPVALHSSKAVVLLAGVVTLGQAAAAGLALLALAAALLVAGFASAASHFRGGRPHGS